MNRIRGYFPIAGIWAVVLLAYSNVYENAFLYDDEFLIQKNTFIRSWSGIFKSFTTSSTAGAGGHDSFFRPMQGALYTIVFQIFGESIFGFHLLNVLLHGLAATFIYLLAQRLSFSKLAALFAALLWCAHPVHVEAVTYQSATADSLYTLLILIAMYICAPEFTVSRVAKASLVFVFALFSKESAIVLPAIAIACLYRLAKPEKRWDWRTYRVTWPLWLVAGLYMIARKTVLNFDNTFQFYKKPNIYSENIIYRTYTFIATLPSYLKLLLWPSDLHMDRNFPVFIDLSSGPTLLGLVMILGAGIAIWFTRHSTRAAFSFAILWFAAAHAPHTGVLLPVNSIFLEHWLYLPTIGLFIWIGDSLSRVKNTRVVFGAVLVVTMALGYLTFRQNEIWATPVSFYSNTIRYEAKVARVHNNLAMAYSDAGQVNEAIAEYQKAISISDEYAQTHHNLGLALLNTGKIPEGIAELEKALQMDPNFYYSAGALSEVYQKMGQTDKAKFYYEKYKELRAKYVH